MEEVGGLHGEDRRWEWKRLVGSMGRMESWEWKSRVGPMGRWRDGDWWPPWGDGELRMEELGGIHGEDGGLGMEEVGGTHGEMESWDGKRLGSMGR